MGRAEELARLLAHVDRAARAESTAVLLAGDAGVGKTRLLDELTGGRPSAGCACSPGTASTSATSACPTCRSSTCSARWPPTRSWRRNPRATPRWPVCSPAARPRPRCRPRRGPRPGSPAAEPGAPQPVDDGRLQLFESVAGLICELAAAGPLLLVLEDVHWADRSSRDLLRYLLARLVDEPVAVVASYRSDDLHRRHPLRPLLAELVRLPGRRAARARAAAGRRGRRPRPRAGRPRWGARAHGRGRRRPRRGQRVLRRGAARRRAAGRGAAARRSPTSCWPGWSSARRRPSRCCGSPRWPGGGCGTSWWPPSVGWPPASWSRRWRRRCTTTCWWSPTTAATGSGTRCCGRRCSPTCCRGAGAAARRDRRLPGRDARRRDGGRAGAPRPGEQRPARALAASLEAADEACRIGAPAEQLQHLETALALWSAVPGRGGATGRDQPRLLLEAAATARTAGELHRAVALLRSALEALGRDGDPVERARVHYTLAQALVRVEDLAGAQRESEAAMALVPAEPPSEVRTWAAATAARMSYSLGRMAEGDAAAEEALAAADALGLDGAWSDTAVSQARRGGTATWWSRAPDGGGAAAGPALGRRGRGDAGPVQPRHRSPSRPGRSRRRWTGPGGPRRGRATSAWSGRSTRRSCGTCR